jgi:hypothetical protein
LTWSLPLIALAAPFAFLAPVLEPPPCDDWLWCGRRYSGVVFDLTPDVSSIAFLLAIPNAFIAFLAARVALGGVKPAAHWFMLGPMLALIGALLLFLIVPIHQFGDDASASYPPALLLETGRVVLYVGNVVGFAAAVLMVMVALVWRASSPLRAPEPRTPPRS